MADERDTKYRIPHSIDHKGHLIDGSPLHQRLKNIETRLEMMPSRRDEEMIAGVKEVTKLGVGHYGMTLHDAPTVREADIEQRLAALELDRSLLSGALIVSAIAAGTTSAYLTPVEAVGICAIDLLDEGFAAPVGLTIQSIRCGAKEFVDHSTGAINMPIPVLVTHSCPMRIVVHNSTASTRNATILYRYKYVNGQ